MQALALIVGEIVVHQLQVAFVIATEKRHITRHEQHVPKRKAIEDERPAALWAEKEQGKRRHCGDGYDQGLATRRGLGEEAYVEQRYERIGEQKGLRNANGYDDHAIEQVAHKRLARHRLADKRHTINKERDAHHLARKHIILEPFLVGNGKEE